MTNLIALITYPKNFCLIFLSHFNKLVHLQAVVEKVDNYVLLWQEFIPQYCLDSAYCDEYPGVLYDHRQLVYPLHSYVPEYRDTVHSHAELQLWRVAHRRSRGQELLPEILPLVYPEQRNQVRPRFPSQLTRGQPTGLSYPRSPWACPGPLSVIATTPTGCLSMCCMVCSTSAWRVTTMTLQPHFHDRHLLQLRPSPFRLEEPYSGAVRLPRTFQKM